MSQDQGERDLPEIMVEDYTEDQITMLELLGGDSTTAQRRYRPYVANTPPGLLASFPSIREIVVHRHACPLVMYRDILRIILPNGDVQSLRSED